MAKNNKKKSKSIPKQKAVSKGAVEGKADQAQPPATAVVQEADEELALAQNLTAATLDHKTDQQTDFSTHFGDMSAIATMSLLVHQQIQRIRVVKEQILELHNQQGVLLEGLTNYLEKLRSAKHTTNADGQIIANTFETVNAQLVDIFSHCLPSLSQLKEEGIEAAPK